MSTPGKAKKMTPDGSLPDAMDRNEVEAIFHKDSYMDGLKNIAKSLKKLKNPRCALEFQRGWAPVC